MLGKAFSLNDNNSLAGTGINYQTFTFSSDHTRHLPGLAKMNETERDFLSAIADSEINENREFRYPVFLPEGYKQTNRAIILLHGLNEKSWDKYLPWARELVLRTGHAVVLFPISFHMNRMPDGWVDPRAMSGLSHLREEKHQGQRCSTFANAAISERLDNMPERFALSGYQSIMDLLNLVNHISSGKHPVFKEETEIHFFGYSIGAFLAQVLMIANPNGLLDKSRFVLFAGGTVFSHINGISRFILDQHAFEQLRTYYLNQDSWRRKTLKSYVKVLEIKNIARAFMAMLSPEYFSSLREKVFAEFNDRMMVYALRDDEVFPEEHILANFHDSGVWVNRIDFPYNYCHETPFPVSSDPELSARVDRSFDHLFREMGNFLKDEVNYGV
jgi:pimeloyl-ACP methyl ester carboxylesterase